MNHSDCTWVKAKLPIHKVVFWSDCQKPQHEFDNKHPYENAIEYYCEFCGLKQDKDGIDDSKNDDDRDD